MMRRLILLCAAFAAGAALAEPPPGHPSPERAMELLAPRKALSASELPHQGKVVSAIHANEYTYLEVVGDYGKRWIAAPRADIQPGATVRYEDGATMSNFYSKLLQRTFDSLMFVGDVMVVPE